jgi:hypothetical protein
MLSPIVKVNHILQSLEIVKLILFLYIVLIYRFTSYTVLNMKFNLDVDQPLQLALIKAIENVETGLSDFQFLVKSCNVLRRICEDPWCSETYEQIMNFQNLTALGKITYQTLEKIF